MVTSYLKHSFRNMTRNKIYTLINIAGLAISLTAFTLMELYIEDELSFDRFHANAGRIYRLEDDKQTPDVFISSASSAGPVGPALQQDFPEIEQSVRLLKAESLIQYNDHLYEERNIFFSDPSVFKVFSFPLLKGNPNTVLKDPQTIVLTEGAATKYFGTADPVGKVLTVDGKSMQVTGVMENVPANSHLQFDFLISMSTAGQKGSGNDWLFTNWYSNLFYTYLLLPHNYDVHTLTSRLSAFDSRHREAKGNTVHFYKLEKLRDVYLHSRRDNQAGKTGSVHNLYIFSAIAFFILLIAVINFINLSTARAAVRAKEVAVKSIVGAARKQLVAQFLTESFLMTSIALVIALLFAYLVLPSFNFFSGKLLTLSLFSPYHLAALLILFLGIGLLSGIYPAFILSGFKPAVSLKGKVHISGFNLGLRKALVVFQFAVSVVLIICSTVVYAQMDFLQRHELGFTPSQTMVINFEGDGRVKEKLDYIKQQLLGIAGVKSVAASSNVPGDNRAGGWSMDVAKKDGDTIHTELQVYLTDYTFMPQYNIPVTAGRALSAQYAADSVESMLINETAVKRLGFSSPQEALGVRVDMYPAMGVITGVFPDFHFESLQKQIEPLAVRVLPSHFRVLSVEINAGDIKQTIAAVEKQWKHLVPERPLEYSFLNESFNNQYQSEVKFGQIFTIFTTLAIVIACLGLFGLALFSIQQRKKEIGIRKVLGASVTSITALVSKEFISLVLIAIVVASPLAAYLMHRWLQDFAYRIRISWWMFGTAGCTALFIALCTISFQAVKAAITNPVQSLRND